MYYDPLLSAEQNATHHTWVLARMRDYAARAGELAGMSDAEWRAFTSELALLNLMNISHNNQKSASND